MLTVKHHTAGFMSRHGVSAELIGRRNTGFAHLSCQVGQRLGWGSTSCKSRGR